MNLPTTPRPCRLKKSPAAQLFAAIAALTLASAPAAYAVNAAWNTDASSGNFNTAQWTSGTNTPAAGGTYTVLSGDALFFGTSTTTTLNNDLSSATYNGLTFNSGASAFTIGGNAFTLNGNITNSSSSLQTISNNLTISSGGKTFAGGTGGLTLSGTSTYSTSSGGLAITGTVNSSGTFTTTGTASGTGFLTLAGAQTLNITGGTFTVNANTNGTTNSIIGQNASGTSTVNVNGGNFVIGGGAGFALGNNINAAIGVLTITSGTATINRGSTTVTDNRSFIALGKDTSTGTINLNGGTLATDRNFVRDGNGGADASGAANFNFGGGTLKALAAQTDWLNSATINTNQLALSTVTTSSAASTIDSNGFTVAINNAITGSGGFHIISSSGNGTVNFGGSSYAYTGTTSVDSGTFNTNAASVTFSGNLAVAGGKLTLNGTGTGSVSTTGFSMSSGTWTVSIGDSVSTSGNVNITGGTLDLAAFNGSEGSNTSYNLFTSIGGSAAISNLSYTGYDTANWTAALGTNGVLTFSAIPEPSTYAALAGVLTLGAAVIRRRIRRSAAPAV